MAELICTLLLSLSNAHNFDHVQQHPDHTVMTVRIRTYDNECQTIMMMICIITHYDYAVIDMNLKLSSSKLLLCRHIEE